MEFEHGVLAQPPFPPEEDEGDDKTHNGSSNHATIRPWLSDSSPLCEEDETASPSHGNGHTDPIAFSQSAEHIAIVSFVGLGSSQGWCGRLEKDQTSKSNTAESGKSARYMIVWGRALTVD
jgi:hypothetical protein